MNNTQYPYDSEDMIYNKKEHVYVLTERGVLNELGINLCEYLNSAGDVNLSTLGLRVIMKISRHLYRYIYSFTSNKAYIEYLLAKYPPCRDMIFQALLNETYFQLRNGDFFNTSDNELGWNRTISPDTRELLSETLPNGVRLNYTGNIALPSDLHYREDY